MKELKPHLKKVGSNLKLVFFDQTKNGKILIIICVYL